MLDPFSALYRILRNTERIMTAQDDEKAALAGLAAAIAAENAQVDALAAQLAASAKATGMDDATVEGFVAQINGLTSGINAKLARFSAPAAPGGDAQAT